MYNLCLRLCVLCAYSIFIANSISKVWWGTNFKWYIISNSSISYFKIYRYAHGGVIKLFSFPIFDSSNDQPKWNLIFVIIGVISNILIDQFTRTNSLFNITFSNFVIIFSLKKLFLMYILKVLSLYLFYIHKDLARWSIVKFVKKKSPWI